MNTTAWHPTADAIPRRHGESTLARIELLSDDALVHSVVAESFLGRSRTALWEMRKRGEIQTVRVGSRSVRYVLGSLRKARAALETQ